MPSVSISSASPTTTRSDVLIVAATSSGKQVSVLAPADEVADAFGRSLQPTLSTLGFTGKEGQVAKLPTNGVVKSPLVILVGVGESAEPSAETLRRAAAVGVKATSNADSVAVAFPTPDDDAVSAVAEGVLLGSYRFDRYKSSPDDDAVNSVVILSERSRTKGGKAAIDRAETVASAVCLARDWVNTGAGDLTPPAYADAVTEAASDDKVKVTVWDDARLTKEGCGGILGVGRASDSESRLVQIAYKPKKPVAHLALVGKGITFDSGGLSIKPGSGMMTMKCDMAGSAAVIAATLAIARLGLPVRVTCVAAMAENMVSGSATRPGDVLTIRGGTTVEVHNTDAEGRLVLADALVVATEHQPDFLVDVATLTGACVVGLGERTAGVLSNDDTLRSAVPRLADSVGEPMWPLPIAEEMRAKVRSSEIADLRQHNPKPVGGTLYAAAFLREFVGESRWAHLDIAGPGFNNESAYGYVPKGGTGVAVRTLVATAQAIADGDLA
ncbi:leucyl aminopeptidase [Solicola gregarius]|uniref:Probable cytosol aminopeptidase n=1 Tax=Solicola gregarius TaxID=2908642 RepID=A0AA46THT9_9ACTN|nr:leucyl aminopeptidase [Solicola gregarius]UYM05436.1 leucyl aminopeptidase [Solicola gregarius]